MDQQEEVTTAQVGGMEATSEEMRYRLDSTSGSTVQEEVATSSSSAQAPAEAATESSSNYASKLGTADGGKYADDAAMDPPSGAESQTLRRRKDLGGRNERKPSVVVGQLAESFLPSKFKPLVAKVGPMLDLASDLWSKAQPHVRKMKKVCWMAHEKLAPYHPEEWLPIIIGLVLCFFGGCFATTIAAVEAFRVTGYASVKQCLQVIYLDQAKVAEALKKDASKDDNHNGVADVDELTDQELAKRKFLLVIRTVDPAELGRAFAGINTGLLAVLAALRVHFAQAVTLGSAIGMTVNNLLAVQLIPKIEKKTSPDFKKWVKPLFNYGTKFLGFMLAMILWRSIMALYSATRGAQMACEGLISYLVRNNYVAVPTKEAGNFKLTKEFVLFSTILAGVGFYWQISSGFSLTFPLNIILLPVTMFEGTLTYLLAA